MPALEMNDQSTSNFVYTGAGWRTKSTTTFSNGEQVRAEFYHPTSSADQDVVMEQYGSSGSVPYIAGVRIRFSNGENVAFTLPGGSINQFTLYELAMACCGGRTLGTDTTRTVKDFIDRRMDRSSEFMPRNCLAASASDAADIPCYECPNGRWSGASISYKRPAPSASH